LIFSPLGIEQDCSRISLQDELDAVAVTEERLQPSQTSRILIGLLGWCCRGLPLLMMTMMTAAAMVAVVEAVSR
jgi:hypothetical protein